MMKKIKLLFLSIPLLIGSLSGCSQTFGYNSFIYKKDGCTYYIRHYYGGPEAELLCVDSSVKDLIVPDDINGIPVVYINCSKNSYYYGVKSGYYESVEHLELGKNVRIFGSDSYSDEDYKYSSSHFISSNYYSSDENVAWPNLKSISLKDSQIEVIPERCFKGSSLLESISFNSNLSYICAEAFSGCSKLKSIKLPNSLLKIGDDAFYNCSLIDEDLVIPSGLIDLGAAFAGTKIIDTYDRNNPTTDIVLNASNGEKCLISSHDIYGYQDGYNYSFDYRIIGSKSINDVYDIYEPLTINSRVISHNCVSNNYNTSFSCSSLFLDGTKYIFDDAFQNINISSVTIDGNLQYIAQDAFDNYYLETIHLEDNTNREYIVFDNALYEKNETGYSLLMIPSRSGNRSLTFHQEMTEICSNVVNSNKIFDVINLWPLNIKNIFQPDPENNSSYDNISRFSSIRTKKYELAQTSSVYRIVDDAICYQDQLLYFPSNKEIETYMTDSSIKTICSNSFYNNKGISCVKLSRHVERIEYGAFGSIRNRSFSLYIPKEVKTIENYVISGYSNDESEKSNVDIYVENATKPNSWTDSFFYRCNVHWGWQFDY